MKRLLGLLILLVSAALAQSNTSVLITGTLTNPNGSNFSGTIYISLLTSPGIVLMPVGIADGVLSITLPSSDRDPNKPVYLVRGVYNDGSAFIATWFVPYSTTTVALATIWPQGSGGGVASGTSLPLTCPPPNLFFMTTAGASYGLNQCTSPNTFSVIAGGATVAWGGVTGTLATQSDLNSALIARLRVPDTAGVWSSGTTYAPNDIAINAGVMYLSIQAGANHTPASSPSFWTPVLSSLAATSLTGTLQAAQEPAHTGDMTNTAGSLTTAVGSIGGKAVTLAGALTTVGAFGLTLTQTGTTNVTLPTSGTLVNTAVTTLASLSSANGTTIPASAGTLTTTTTVNNNTLPSSWTNVVASGAISTTATGAGALECKAGGGQTITATYSIGIQCPATVVSPFMITLWASPAAGVAHFTGGNPQIGSVSPVVAADTDATIFSTANPVTFDSGATGSAAPITDGSWTYNTGASCGGASCTATRGGLFNLMGGTGGTATGTTSNGGAGGSVTISSGAGGVGTSTTGNPGQLDLQSGGASFFTAFPTGGVQLSSAQRNTSTAIVGGRSTSSNGVIGPLLLQGGDQTGTGGSASQGGNVGIYGGANAATNAGSTAGTIEMFPGLSTGATQGRQGLVMIGYAFGFATTPTQWNLACQDPAGGMQVKDCGATPGNVLGVSELIGTNTVRVVNLGEVAVNASAAVSVGHSVCAGASSPQVTDSGGASPCASGVTVGWVVAVGGTWTFQDGTTFTASTTLPVISLNIFTSAGGGGSGTVNSGTGNQLTWYATTGSAVSGNADWTIVTHALTAGASAALDLHAATGAIAFKVPVQAGATAAGAGAVGYDSTAGNLHIGSNGADAIAGALTGTITNGHCMQAAVSSGNIQLVDSGSTNCGGGGSVLWSGIGNPTGNLSLSMGTDTSLFTYSSALASAFQWYNSTAATSGTSQSGPALDLSCGNEWHGGSPASTKGCATIQFVPGNGLDAANTIAITHTGSATGQTTTTFPGPVASGWDGSHSSAIWLQHFGTTNGVPASGINIDIPASGTASDFIWPGASATGFGYWVNSSNTATGSIAELSGDVTTSGSTATTVVKVNGGSIPASARAVGTNSSNQIVAISSGGLSAIEYIAGGGTAQVQTATLSPAVGSLAAGLVVKWLPVAANTATAPTLNLNGLGAKTITKLGTTALVANDLTTTAIAEAFYDGTQWQLQNPQTVASSGVATTGSPASGNLTKFSGASTITNGDLSGDVTTSGTLAASVVKVNGAIVPVSTALLGSNGSGQLIAGTPMTSLMGDLAVVRTSGTVLTIGSGCSSTTPCNVRIGSKVYNITSSATGTLSSTTGDAFIYIDGSNGNITIGSNMTVTCSGCTATGSITAFPVNSVPIWTWSAATSTWNTLGADQRSFFSSQPNYAAGVGVSLTPVADTLTIGADLAIIPAVVGTSTVTARSTSQTTVTVATSPAAGPYDLKYYVDQNATCTTGSNSVSFTFNWTDATHARSLATGSMTMGSSQLTSGYLSGTIPIYVGSGNVTYTSTVSGACATGTSSYDIHVILPTF